MIQHVNRMPRNRLPRVLKHYSPTGRRNRGRSLKRLLDSWDRNGSTSGPTPLQIYDDDDPRHYFVFQNSHGHAKQFLLRKFLDNWGTCTQKKSSPALMYDVAPTRFMQHAVCTDLFLFIPPSQQRKSKSLTYRCCKAIKLFWSLSCRFDVRDKQPLLWRQAADTQAVPVREQNWNKGLQLRIVQNYPQERFSESPVNLFLVLSIKQSRLGSQAQTVYMIRT